MSWVAHYSRHILGYVAAIERLLTCYVKLEAKTKFFAYCLRSCCRDQQLRLSTRADFAQDQS